MNISFKTDIDSNRFLTIKMPYNDVFSHTPTSNQKQLTWTNHLYLTNN